MRIGVLGGSFNPVHFGHIQLAKWAIQEYALDRVLFVAAKTPPHKEVAFDVPPMTRFEMLKLGLQNEASVALVSTVAAGAAPTNRRPLSSGSAANLFPSALEITREGVSYTVDTLVELRRVNRGVKLFLILGEDMLFDFPNWKMPEKIAQLAKIITYARPGARGRGAGESRDLAAQAAFVSKAFGAHVSVGSFAGLDIASSNVRDAVFHAKPAGHMVPLAVEEYIYENGLYFPDHIQNIRARLKETLKNKRFRHIMGTTRWAVALAAAHGVDPEKARLAALLHDCAKFAPEVQLEMAEKRGLTLTKTERVAPSLLHARLGVILAQEEFGVRDPEILNAIRCHTFCQPHMSRLDKLLYVADKTEINRSFPGASGLRRKALRNLDEGTVACMEYVIAHTRNSGKQLDNTIFKAKREIEKSLRRKKFEHRYTRKST